MGPRADLILFFHLSKIYLFPYVFISLCPEIYHKNFTEQVLFIKA